MSALLHQPTTLWRLPSRAVLAAIVCLGVIFAAMRAVSNLGPPVFRPLLPLGFVLMAVLPWVLLTAEGRRAIGLRAPKDVFWGTAVGGGAAAALAVALLMWLGFGQGTQHAYVSIAQNFQSSVPRGLSLPLLFVMFTVPAMLFSPVGEEIFFRGIFQQALAERFGNAWATTAESLAFGVVHLFHHGLLWTQVGFQFAGVSAWVWLVLMSMTAAFFCAHPCAQWFSLSSHARACRFQSRHVAVHFCVVLAAGVTG